VAEDGGYRTARRQGLALTWLPKSRTVELLNSGLSEDRVGMHYTGETGPLTDGEVPRDVPVFLTGESASEELLFARTYWGLEDLTQPMPSLAGTPVKTAPLQEGERERVAQLWGAGWQSLWAMYGSSYDDIDGAHIPGISASPPIEWARMAAPAALPAESLSAWRNSFPRSEPIGDRYFAMAESGHAAFQRGLSCVVVLPLSGLWTQRVRRMLLVSGEVHASTTLLKAAIDAF